MGRCPGGDFHRDHSRPSDPALIGRESARTFVRCYGPAASRPECMGDWSETPASAVGTVYTSNVTVRHATKPRWRTRSPRSNNSTRVWQPARPHGSGRPSLRL
jgi:hypothetical protein